MAYSGLISYDNLGDGDWLITVTELEGGVATEAETIILPWGGRKCRVHRVKTSKSAGASTTLQPTLGSATDPVANDAVELQLTAAAEPDEQFLVPIKVLANADGELFHRLLPDAAADNDVVTEYRLSEDWDDDLED